MSKLYRDDGYVNISYLDSRGLPFNVVTGGRGTGKTFTTLSMYLTAGKKIVYMRRTREEMDYSASPDFTPYKKVCDFNGVPFAFTKGKVKVCYNEETGAPIACFCALSSIATIRGFDASDCDAIVYDEFIPEKRCRPIKDEGEAVFNAYETINRNRELNGLPPVKMWLLSNSNDIFSPVLSAFGVLDIALKMERNQTEEYIDRSRGLQIISLFNSPISEKKSDTALYKLAGREFSDMALRNLYRFDDTICVSRNLREYDPIVMLGEVVIYRHKANRKYYATTHLKGSPSVYGTSEKEIKNFISCHGYLFHAFRTGKMEVENMNVYYILEYYFR